VDGSELRDLAFPILRYPFCIVDALKTYSGVGSAVESAGSGDWRDPTTPSHRGEILIVDDTQENLRILSELLVSEGYLTRPVSDGEAALEAASAAPPELILLDILMPAMDGFEVCRRLKQDPRLRDVPVIFLSAMDELADKVRAFAMGGVDFISKPFQFDEVRMRVETHLRLRRLQIELESKNRRLVELVSEQVREISDSQMATIFALAKLAESRDGETGKHIERVQLYCKLLAATLAEQPAYAGSIEESFIENIFLASPLHDIGKVAIRDHILLKQGELTPSEFEEMKMHTTLGAATLEAVRTRYPRNEFLRLGIEIARCHHERWDGKGYPAGLSGRAIPLSARIMAVADSYDAARSRRCYKPSLSHQECRIALVQRSGSYLDPDVITAFEDVQGLFEDIASALNDGN
jgi:putative two-component system response regulator